MKVDIIKKNLRIIVFLLIMMISSIGDAQKKESISNNENSASNKKQVEFNNSDFVLNKPLKKEDYRYTFKNAEVFFEQKNNFQEINIVTNNTNIKSKLVDLYISANLHFYLYENVNNIKEKLLLLEGDDYYGGVFGVYYINDNSIKKLDFLQYIQDDPEKNGIKELDAKIKKNNGRIICQFYLGKQQIFSKDYSLDMVKNNNIQDKIIDSFNFDFDNDNKKDKVELISEDKDEKTNILLFYKNSNEEFKLVNKSKVPHEYVFIEKDKSNSSKGLAISLVEKDQTIVEYIKYYKPNTFKVVEVCHSINEITPVGYKLKETCKKTDKDISELTFSKALDILEEHK